MMFRHQRRWSWLQSLGGKGIGSTRVLWGQDTGSSPWLRVASEDYSASWDHALSGFYMPVFKWSFRRSWGSEPGKRVGSLFLPSSLPSSVSC